MMTPLKLVDASPIPKLYASFRKYGADRQAPRTYATPEKDLYKPITKLYGHIANVYTGQNTLRILLLFPPMEESVTQVKNQYYKFVGYKCVSFFSTSLNAKQGHSKTSYLFSFFMRKEIYGLVLQLDKN